MVRMGLRAAIDDLESARVSTRFWRKRITSDSLLLFREFLLLLDEPQDWCGAAKNPDRFKKDSWGGQILPRQFCPQPAFSRLDSLESEPTPTAWIQMNVQPRPFSDRGKLAKEMNRPPLRWTVSFDNRQGLHREQQASRLTLAASEVLRAIER